MNIYNILILLRCISVLSDGSVTTLDTSNFDEFVNKGYWLIEFYAPFCGHCKRLLPEFEKAGSVLKEKKDSDGNKIGVTLGKVNCTDHNSICKKFNVRGYPTILFLADGVYKNTYRSQRSSASVVEYCTRMAGPTVTLLYSDTVAKEFISARQKHDHRMFIAISFDNNIKETPQQWLELASKYRDRHTFAFGTVQTNKTILSLVNITCESTCPPVLLISSGGGIDTYNNNNNNNHINSGSFNGDINNIKDLEGWYHINKFPLISKIDVNNFPELANSGRKLVLVCVDGSTLDDTLRGIMIDISSKWRNEFVMAYVDVRVFGESLKIYRVDGSKLPKVVVLDDSNSASRKFWEDDTLLTVDDFDAGIERLLDGKLTPHYDLSEPVSSRALKTMSNLVLLFTSSWWVAISVSCCIGVVLSVVMFACYYCCVADDAEDATVKGTTANTTSTTTTTGGNVGDSVGKVGGGCPVTWLFRCGGSDTHTHTHTQNDTHTDDVSNDTKKEK
eukprot:GHVR01078666.1.p1 GENE.GHVR01078666.1~~GHVR01078666.1.p1  ORF type:complete len:503 (-),score=137.16 GHVR01078666.1:4-1512(-)